MTLKYFIVKILSSILSWLGICRRSESAPIILMYHSITAGQSKDLWTITQKDFIEQLNWLKRNSYSVFFVEDLLEKEFDLPKKSCAITFDDGFLDNLTLAAPALKQFEYPFTVYVSLGLSGRDGFMSREQVRELSCDPACRIGGHGFDHVSLDSVTEEKLINELLESKSQLEELIGKNVGSMSFPNGKYSLRAVELVEEFGYSHATTSHFGAISSSSNVFTLPRVEITGFDDIDCFALKINGYWDWYSIYSDYRYRP